MFFHLKSEGFRCRWLLAASQRTAEVKKREVRQTAAEETAGHVCRITTPMRFNPMRASA